MSLTNTQLKAVQDATVDFMNQQFTENLWSPDVCSQTDALFYLLQDMMHTNHTNAERPLETAQNSVLDNALGNYKRMSKASAHTEAVPSDAREVIIDTFFVQTVILARDIFQTSMGRAPSGIDVAIMNRCAGIFDEGMKREIKQSSEWKTWCEELSEMAHGIIVYESMSEGASDECFSLNTMSAEDAQEYEVLKDDPRGHLLKAHEEVLQRHKWEDFARKEGPLDEADPAPVAPEVSTSRRSSSASSASTCSSIASGSEPPSSMQIQNPSMHTVEQSNDSHQGPQV
jgi:hypothetical protein